MSAAPTIVGKKNMRVGMTNWNGNLLCAIDTETTGFNPELHEVLEIAVIPLDFNFEIHTLFPPFTMMIRPSRFNPNDVRPPGLTDSKIAKYKLYGLEEQHAADVFTEWFEKLNLGPGKKIMPLAHNWPFDRSMIQSWLGPKNYEHVFHFHFRDTMALANTMNDIAELKNYEVIPHPKKDLGSLCYKYGVNLENAHTAIDDARATGQLYAQMIKTMHL